MITYNQYCAYIEVQIGEYRVKTPNVTSVNITRSRGNPVSAASIQFLYSGSTIEDIRSESKRVRIRISSGKNGGSSMSTYFVGTVKKVSIAPTFRVAKEYAVRIQAEDDMYKLANKRFTRRQKSNGIGPVAIITNKYKRPDLGFDDPTMKHNIEREGSTIETITQCFNFREMYQFMDSGQNNTLGDQHCISKIADKLKEVSPASGGASAGLHDHSSMESPSTSIHGGGPSISTFGVR